MTAASLVLAGLVVGLVAGALAASRPARQPPPTAPQAEPMPTVAVDEAMALDLLARTVALLARLEPIRTRQLVDEMQDRALLALHLHAALAVILASPETVRRARTLADTALIDRMWTAPPPPEQPS